VIFAGMSGSAIADAAGSGKVQIDMMTKGGAYPPSYAAVALRVAAAKLEAAGTLKPKNDKVKSDGTAGQDNFEDVDFSTLVTDRYSGQVYIIPNK
jgi:hypothetical protein